MSSSTLAAVHRESAVDALELVNVCAVCRGGDIEQVDAECNLCRCRECDFVFDNPRPGERAIVSFYSRPGQYDSWLDNANGRDALWRRRVKKLLPHRVPGNLLDIGTGIGQFLAHARPYFSSVDGTEVSESAMRIARERYGLDIHRGQVEDLNLAEGSYDNITLFHVLEHVPDPARLVSRCHELLRPGGILAVAVPNDVLAWSSWVKRAGRSLGLPPFRKFSRVLGIAKAGTSREIHLSHFTPEVLHRLIIHGGFSIVEQGLDPYYAASGLWRLVHGCHYALHRALLAVSGINRYETIWLVAKKKAELSTVTGG